MAVGGNYCRILQNSILESDWHLYQSHGLGQECNWMERGHNTTKFICSSKEHTQTWGTP